MTPPRRSIAAIVGLAPAALAIIAEAAWISVVGGLLQEFTLRATILSVPTLVLFVLGGVIAARALAPRLGARWPFLAVVLVAIAAALGWALSGEARDAMSQGILTAVAAHPGGLVAGLAMLRGFAHARLPLAEDTVARLISVGVPGLAFASVLGGLIAEPFRSRFLADALGAAIVFIAAAAMALALTRLDAIGADGGFDWRQNPRWLVLTIVILALAIVGAIPLAAVAGTVLSVLLSAAVVPLLIVGFASGLDPAGRRILAGMGMVVLVILGLTRIFGNPKTNDGTGATGLPGGSGLSPVDQVVSISFGGILLLIAIVAAVVLIAVWMRRRGPAEDGVDETRTIDSSGSIPVPAHVRPWFRTRPAPKTAVEAYLRLDEHLARHAEARRDPAETPAAHAARIRAGGRPTLGLDLLAADYALARYGGTVLTPGEDRRGVDRWRRLRRSLTQGGRARPSATAAEAVVPSQDVDAEGTRMGTRAGG